MLAAYLDAAGSQDDGKDALFVSGFVSTVDRWETFEIAWEVLLRRFGIPPPFHMSEFALGFGQYADWFNDLERRKEFLTAAVDTILENVLHSVSCGVLLSAFDTVNRIYQLQEDEGGPFALCALKATGRVLAWAKAHNGGNDTVVRIVFEAGDNGWGDFSERFRGATGHYPNRAVKGEFAAHQAADIIGYEHAKLVRDANSGRVTEVEQIRKPFLRFEQDGRKDWLYQNHETLLKNCSVRNLPFRPSR